MGCLVVFKIVVSFFLAVLGLRGYVGFSLFAASRGVYGVAQSRTRLKRLSSSSSSRGKDRVGRIERDIYTIMCKINS